MQVPHTLFTAILAASFLLLISSCKEKDNPIPQIQGEVGVEYAESINTWEGLRDENGNSYAYESEVSSVFGFNSTTTIVVDNGQVISRSYEAFDENGMLTDSYTENQSELNSHDQGSPALTVDELYVACGDNISSADPSQNTIVFTTTDWKLMTTCGHVPNGCQDDCFDGIRITGFEWR